MLSPFSSLLKRPAAKLPSFLLFCLSAFVIGPFAGLNTTASAQPAQPGEWVHFGEVMFGGNYDAAVLDDGNIFIFGSESRIIDERGDTLWQSDRGDNHMTWIDQVPAVGVDSYGGVHAISRVSGSAQGGFVLEYQYRPKDGEWGDPIQISDSVPRNYAVGVAGINEHLAYIAFSEQNTDNVWGIVNFAAVENGVVSRHGSIGGFRIDNILDLRRAGNRLYLAFGNNSPNGFSAYHTAEIQPSVSDTFEALEDSQIRFQPTATGQSRRGFPRLFGHEDGSVDMTMGSQIGNTFWARSGTDGSLEASDFIQTFDDLGEWHLSVGVSAAATLPGTNVVMVAALPEDGRDDLVTKLSYDGGQTWGPEVPIASRIRGGEGRGRIQVLASGNTFYVGYPFRGPDGAMGMSRYTVDVSGIPLTISEDPLPSGISGVSHAPYQFTATGATDPITWSVTAGSLPSGLSLSNSGQISGTPTLAGSYSFTVEATDADSKTDTAGFTLVVVDPPSGDGILIMDSGVAEEGPSGASSSSFMIENTGAPANYLVIAAATETNPVSSIDFAGSPMTQLFMANETAAYTSFWGIETTVGSGQLDVQFADNVHGTQIFGYFFLTGVDIENPLRSEDSLGADSFSSSLVLSFPTQPVAGDLAILVGNENNRGAGVSVAPIDETLFAGSAGATFSALVGYANPDSGSYAPSFTFSANQRALAAGIILAAQPAPDPGGFQSWIEQYSIPADQQGTSQDYDKDGVPHLFEYLFGLSPVDSSQPTITVDLDNDPRQLQLPKPVGLDGLVWQILYSADLGSEWTVGYSSDGVTGNPDGTITLGPEGVTPGGQAFIRANLPTGNTRLFLRLQALEE